MKIEEIRKELRNNVDESYRVFQSALIPGVENFLGVRRPVLRRLAARILKEDGRKFIREAGRDSFEEILLKGIVIGGLSGSAEEILELARAYIPEITDWCLCDTFCHDLKAAKRKQEEFYKLAAEYMESEKEFEARFAAVLLLEHFICEGWIDRTLEALSSVRQQGYYAQMAVAWAYSMCYVKFPGKTEGFLSERKLPEFTYRKTISKICDSHAVRKEDKERLKRNGFQRQLDKE